MAKPRKRPNQNKGRVPSNKANQKPTEEQNHSSNNSETTSSAKNSADAEASEKVTNDPAWYERDAALLEGSAHFNFSDPFGKVFDFSSKDIPTSGASYPVAYPSSHEKSGIPGVMGVRLCHTVGYARDRRDAINVSAVALYTQCRYKNSGRKNYDPADLGIYMITIGELYSFVNWATRIYNMCFSYSQTNQYVNRGIASAMHVNYDDVLNNLANFRYWLNSFINKVSSYAIPDGITYYNKRVSQFTYVYLENDDMNIKDQMYLFYPDNFYKFALDADGRGMLLYNAIDYSSDLTYQNIINIGNNLLSGIWGDEDFGTISGDIIKAFEGKIIGLTSMPEEGILVPVFDLLALNQIRNATIVYQSSTTTEPWRRAFGYKTEGSTKFEYGDIYQDNDGNINHRIAVSMSNTSMTNQYIRTNKLLDMNSPTPGLGDNIEGTRLMVTAGDQKSGTGDTAVEIHTGSDFVRDLDIVVGIATNGGNPVFSRYRLYSNMINQTDFTTYAGEQLRLAFKYAPIAIYCNASYDSGTGKWNLSSSRIISNVDNYTMLEKEQIEKTHDCALLSLLYIPGVAKFVNMLQGR